MRVILATVLALLTSLANLAQQPDAPVVVLDPGHPSEIGNGTAGKSITELKLCWNVALLAKERLEDQGWEVILTKQSMNQMVKNRARAEIANRAKADLMIRLHADYAPGQRGWATIYADRPGKDGSVTGPSTDVLRQVKPMAIAFHKASVQTLKGQVPDRGMMTDRQTHVGSQRGALIGSIHSKVPSILVEMVVLNHPKDDAFAGTAKGQSLLANAVVAGTQAALRVKPMARSSRQ